MEELTLEQKAEYVKRIDDKARLEGISNKYAARKLGLHEWRYYQYKNDIKRSKVPAVAEKPDPLEVSITIILTKQAYDYLVEEARDFAISPHIVAQMMLHTAIMKQKKNGNT